MNTWKGTLTKSKPPSPARPPLPKNIVISGPTPINPIGENQKTIPIKRQVSKPSRPPPPANSIPNVDVTGSNKAERPPRPPRPRSRDAVAQWWREVELGKGSGFSGDGEALEWFHGKQFGKITFVLVL